MIKTRIGRLQLNASNWQSVRGDEQVYSHSRLYLVEDEPRVLTAVHIGILIYIGDWVWEGR